MDHNQLNRARSPRERVALAQHHLGLALSLLERARAETPEEHVEMALQTPVALTRSTLSDLEALAHSFEPTPEPGHLPGYNLPGSSPGSSPFRVVPG